MLSMKLAEYRRVGVAALMAGLVAVAGCDDDPIDPTDPSNFGEVEVDVVTTGYEPDFTDYSVSLEGGGAVTVEPSGSVTLFGAPSGSNSVSLEVPEHCTVDANPQTVTVTAGETANLTFNVTCTAITGSLTPSIVQTGAPEDFDAEVLVTTDLDDEIVVNTANPEEVFNITPGDRVLTLSGVAANCTPTLEEQTVTVAAGVPNPFEFTLDCVPNVGDLTVNVTTTGTNPDDGYTLTVGDMDPVNIPANGASEFNSLRVGAVDVVLGGIAANCTAAGGEAGVDAEETASIVFGAEEMATVDFTVVCE